MVTKIKDAAISVLQSELNLPLPEATRIAAAIQHMATKPTPGLARGAPRWSDAARALRDPLGAHRHAVTARAAQFIERYGNVSYLDGAGRARTGADLLRRYRALLERTYEHMAEALRLGGHLSKTGFSEALPIRVIVENLRAGHHPLGGSPHTAGGTPLPAGNRHWSQWVYDDVRQRVTDEFERLYDAVVAQRPGVHATELPYRIRPFEDAQNVRPMRGPWAKVRQTMTERLDEALALLRRQEGDHPLGGSPHTAGGTQVGGSAHTPGGAGAASALDNPDTSGLPPALTHALIRAEAIPALKLLHSNMPALLAAIDDRQALGTAPSEALQDKSKRTDTEGYWRVLLTELLGEERASAYAGLWGEA